MSSVKTKLIVCINKSLEFESRINDFIKDKEVVDMKFNHTDFGYTHGSRHVTFSVLIMYKEIVNE